MSIIKNLTAGVGAVVVAGALLAAGAGTARAQVNGSCGDTICIAANKVWGSLQQGPGGILIKYVRVYDATVSLKDGGTAYLHVFIGDSTEHWSASPVREYRASNFPNEFKPGTLICGDAYRDAAHTSFIARQCFPANDFG